jgi:hypothetical protein
VVLAVVDAIGVAHDAVSASGAVLRLAVILLDYDRGERPSASYFRRFGVIYNDTSSSRFSEMYRNSCSIMPTRLSNGTSLLATNARALGTSTRCLRCDFF